MTTAQTQNPLITAACYLRISSDPSGQQLGVARQRKDCERLCAEKGWTPVEYVDNDISASDGKHRPAYQRMLADIEAGQISAVVAWDLDRLHRRPIELEHFMAAADTHRIALATVAGDVDLSTEQGRLVARMKGNVAAYEIGQMKHRMVAKHRQRAEQGLPYWKRAFGYVIGEHESGCTPSCKSHHHQLDPNTAPLVKQAYADILAGVSLADVARLFNEAGALSTRGNPWTAAKISGFLRSPRNAGLRSYTTNGKTEILGAGTWPALVEESTFRAAVAALDSRPHRSTRRSVRKHLLTGVLGCGKCGHYLSGNVTMHGALTYTCRACLGVSIRAEHAEPLLYDLVIGRLAKADAVDLLKAEVHDAAQAEALRLERNTLLARIEAIGVDYADGLLTGVQAKAATDRVAQKLDTIDAAQQDTERLRVFDGIPLGGPEVDAAIRRLSPDRFRAVLDVLATVTVAPVGKTRPVFNPERVQITWS